MTAFKIMPFDGSMIVNDEVQKTSKELVPEVVASVHDSVELSALAKSSGDFVAHNFIHLEGVTICSCAYPPVLMNERNAWDKEHASENETPAIFGDDQLFSLPLLLQTEGRILIINRLSLTTWSKQSPC